MKDCLRVLIWCPLVSPGGGARLLTQLSQAIAKQPAVELVRLLVGARHDLNFAADAGVEVKELTQGSWLEREGRIWGIKGTGRMKRSLRNALDPDRPNAYASQLQQMAQDCDVIYAFWPHRQEFPRLAKPIVCTFQDATFFDFPEILGRAETSAEWRRAQVWVAEATKVVVSSQATRNALIRHFGPCCAEAQVIHHAILPTKCATTAARQPSLKAGLPTNYVVCPANVTPHKNHYVLLVAWSRFTGRREHPLVLFGPGTQRIIVAENDWPDYWQYARLSGLVARCGLRLGQDVHALGYVDDQDVLPLIGNAAALVMPTLSEGGGSYPVEEALSLGVPVLCSDIPVMREHLSSRSAKIAWFDPESPDSLGRALDDLFANYDQYKRSALAAIMDPRPSWDDVAAQYISVFQNAIGLRSQTRGVSSTK